MWMLETSIGEHYKTVRSRMHEETGSGKKEGVGSADGSPSRRAMKEVSTDEEFVGPEYEEDAYYSNASLAATPSFDDLEISDSEEILVHWHQDTGEIEEIEEADFKGEHEGHVRSTRGELRKLRARIGEKLRGLVALYVCNGVCVCRISQIEDEIQTLREVLASKVSTAHLLKRKLGISVWKELSEDVGQGLKNVKESHVYQNVGEKFGQFTRTVSENSLFQKTESVFKSTAEKTTSILGGFGSGLSMKIGQMRNSDSFRSLEEKVGSAYENVKGRVTPSRSNSTQSFDEALREAGASRRTSAAPSVTSPTIPEEKMLS
ncbi:uncharacterized protein LOC106647942 [Copidosoma floridanum]|uniref:uncharacterized protein LOC106647942 n=1 Tax=Copidosoma floridanum TaxID=29053 RepID=UPI000C6F872D|nr:uncharacterized protein LOC106647942 [Copidosoma floridanum]